jgi:GntR family transcriptional regulator
MENHGKTLSQHLHERLRQLISETEPGGRLPSEPKLAKQMGVSRATLREAMRLFETQGVIHRRQGVGTFVIPPSQVMDTGLEVLESILTQAERKNLKITVGPYSMIEREATEKEAEVLGISPDRDVLQISWVMETPDRPVAYLCCTGRNVKFGRCPPVFSRVGAGFTDEKSRPEIDHFPH